MTGSSKDLKRMLRAALRKALMTMPTEQRAAESAGLCAAIRQLPEYRRARTVSLFCPMPFEVNLLDLLRDSRKPPEVSAAAEPRAESQSRRFVFPLTHDDRSLTWHAVHSIWELAPGRMGIPEPDPARSPAVDPAEIGLVIVPGLGFTLEGGRLGFGGGYYDRFLAGTGPGTPTLGACLSCQIVPVEHLPVEPHDIPVQRVLHG
ncbi:MAG: 5-formyltetrahydrofolate cyclo-ligase [Verrucomicrobiota bacterium]